MNERVLVWGAGSQARVCIDMLRGRGKTDVVIFDPLRGKPTFETEHPFFGFQDDLADVVSEVAEFIVCIGGTWGWMRVQVAELLSSFNLRAQSIRSDHCVTAQSVQHGPGLLQMENSVVQAFTTLGTQVVINTSASVDHECRIGDGVHIMGAAAIAGRVIIDDFASIGTNATILPDVRIGPRAIVGAGAVVTKDVPERVVVVGTPARVLREVDVLEEESAWARICQTTLPAWGDIPRPNP